MTEEEFRTGILADGTRLMQPDYSAEIVTLINELRAYEGDSVTILCDNPDFNGEPNNAIICNGDWTNWQDRRFAADTVVACLRLAAVERRALTENSAAQQPDAGSQTPQLTSGNDGVNT